MSEAVTAEPHGSRRPSPTDRSRHVPGYIYASPEIYAREKRCVFMMYS